MHSLYSSKIIPPIQSRCVVLRFKPIDRESMKGRLKDIASKEGFEIDDDSLEGGTDSIQMDALLASLSHIGSEIN